MGTVDKDEPASPSHSGAGGAPASEPTPPAKHSTLRFVGVKAADDFVRSLAPLRALRAVGKIEGTRAEEFGFDKPEGTLKLTLAGKPQSLLIGGATPGGSERYAKSASGDVFAISGEIVQNLLYADSRLAERELQSFKPEEATRVKVSRAGKSRDLSRVPQKNEGWADSSTPTKLDETAGNWMAKLGRLQRSGLDSKSQAPRAGRITWSCASTTSRARRRSAASSFTKCRAKRATSTWPRPPTGAGFARVITSGPPSRSNQDSTSLVK